MGAGVFSVRKTFRPKARPRLAPGIPSVAGQPEARPDNHVYTAV